MASCNKFTTAGAALLIGAALFHAPVLAAQSDPIQSAQATFRLVTVADKLEHPWSVAFLPGDEYLVSERRGRIWRVSAQGEKTPISGAPVVFEEGQGGLLDLAVEPGFQDGGWLYMSYAATDPQNKDIANTEIARGRLSLADNTLGELEVIFRAEPKVKGDNHWGSRFLFAPDGSLFITLGERFDYKEEAQNLDNHLGKVIRLMPDGTIPPDNPFLSNKDARPEIYSYGHRNSQGIALHPQSGQIWMHEHGPKGGDEINILKPAANYGWPKVTFGISYWGLPISDKTSVPGMEDSILQWTPSIAPSGMTFYTGDKFPQWKGDLFVGALAGQHLRRLDLDGEKITGEEELLSEREKRIRDVRTGPDGFLYILTDESEGQLLRLEPAAL